MAKKKQFAAMTAFDVREIIKKGQLKSELDLERAVWAGRSLRLMIPDHPKLAHLEEEISRLIIQYESEHWSDVSLVTKQQVRESDLAEKQVEREFKFIKKRKGLILKNLKNHGLNQNALAAILAHSKSYTSELLSGIRTFSMNDLIIIHRLFKIKLEDLIFTEITDDVEKRISETIEKASKNSLKSKKTAQVSSLVKALYS